MPRPTHYTQRIADMIERQHLNAPILSGGTITYRPHHVEAYMRLEHSTLDGLSQEQFIDEVVLACECILVGGVDRAEVVAKSFGLGEG